MPGQDEGGRLWAFGDESGNFRNLLNGHCSHFSLSIVVGDRFASMGCVKGAIRRAEDLQEARWNELTDLQKRRVIDEINSRAVEIFYLVIDRDDLRDIKHNFALYDADRMTVRPSCYATATMYAALLGEAGLQDIDRFNFDRITSRNVSDEVISVLQRIGVQIDAKHVSSTTSKGVQVADCAAGAVNEIARNRARHDTDEWVNVTEYALGNLERWLEDFRVGP